MIRFTTEQFVPCRLPHITASIERTVLPSTAMPLYLQNTFYACSMHEGWRLESPKGVYLLDSLDLIQSIHGNPACMICRTEADMRELEQYYAQGIIGYVRKDHAALMVFNEGEQYRTIYRNGELSWFSMVPTKIELDLTSACNLACSHCSRVTTESPGPDELNLEELISFLEQAGRIGVSTITFMGGEPTCHPELIELALVARLSGIRSISVGTNGWLVDEKLAARMAAVFDSIQVSLHGTNAVIHDNIVGRQGSFERSIQSIRYLKAHSARRVTISYTVTHDNAAGMETAARLARDLEVDSIRFLLLTPKGRGASLPQLSERSRSKIGTVVNALHEKFKGELVIEAGGTPPYTKVPPDAAFYGCAAGRSLMYVSSHGEVKPCAVIDTVVGSIRESSILDLWHRPEFVAIREAKRCHCSFSSICAGICLASIGNNPENPEMGHLSVD